MPNTLCNLRYAATIKAVSYGAYDISVSPDADQGKDKHFTDRKPNNKRKVAQGEKSTLVVQPCADLEFSGFCPTRLQSASIGS